MTTNRVSYDFTPENFLARMGPNVEYTMYALTGKFKLPTDVVRPMVEQLIADGAIQLRKSGKNNLYSRQEGAKAAPVEPPPVDLHLSVAAPPMPPDMKGVLSGIEVGFQRRIALCMLARGAR